MAEIYNRSMEVAKLLNELANMFANLEPVVLGIQVKATDGEMEVRTLPPERKTAYKTKMKAKWNSIKTKMAEIQDLLD